MKIIRTVNLIPFNKDKTQICLVKRVSTDVNNGKWSFPGESIQDGESMNQAMIRIIANQMSCSVYDIIEFKKTEKKVKISVVKSQYVLGSIEGNIKLDERKYSDFKWVDFDSTLMSYDYAFAEKNIVTNLLNKFEK